MANYPYKRLCYTKNTPTGQNPVRVFSILEATPGFEPGNEGFADLGLTTWLCRLI